MATPPSPWPSSTSARSRAPCANSTPPFPARWTRWPCAPWPRTAPAATRVLPNLPATCARRSCAPGAALSPIRSRERSRNASAREMRRQAVRRKRRLRRASFFAAIGVGVAIIGVLIWYFAAVHNMGASPWPSARRRPLPWTPLPGAVLCPSSSALTARNTRKGWSWNSPSPQGKNGGWARRSPLPSAQVASGYSLRT